MSEETISLLVGAVSIENFDGNWIRLNIGNDRIQLCTEGDAKRLVTALWDDILKEIASDKASAHEIYDASLSDSEREAEEMESP
jgi:hypothetical protein